MLFHQIGEQSHQRQLVSLLAVRQSSLKVSFPLHTQDGKIDNSHKMVDAQIKIT